MITTIFEIRARIIELYGRLEYLLIPAFRFAVAFLCLLLVNKHIGFREELTNTLLCAIIALVCALVPPSFIAGIIMVVILVHLYTLSLEVTVVAGVLFLLTYLLFFRFSPKDSMVVLLMPIASSIGLPYAVPVAAGLLMTPGASIGCAFSVLVINFLKYIENNTAILRNAEIGEQTIANFRIIIDGFMHNREMWITAAAFAAAVIVVFFIRRLETAHSWTIAILAGNIMELFVLLLGDMEYDINIDFTTVFIGVFASLIVELLIEFFCFMVDYTRQENVQFEDDDYYYYVKAIPKVTVSAPVRTVKTISFSGGAGGKRREESAPDSGKDEPGEEA